MEQIDKNEKEVNDFIKAADDQNKKNKEDFEKKREERIRKNDSSIEIYYRKSERKRC